jgi:hypothetical protein
LPRRRALQFPARSQTFVGPTRFCSSPAGNNVRSRWEHKSDRRDRKAFLFYCGEFSRDRRRMKSGGTPPHSKTWPQFPRPNRASILECGAAASLFMFEAPRRDVLETLGRKRTSPRAFSKRGRAGNVHYLVRAPGRWPEGPRPLPPFLCCFACRN